MHTSKPNWPEYFCSNCLPGNFQWKVDKTNNIFGTLIKGIKAKCELSGPTDQGSQEWHNGWRREVRGLAGSKRQTNLTLTRTTTACDGLCIMLITRVIYRAGRELNWLLLFHFVACNLQSAAAVEAEAAASAAATHFVLPHIRASDAKHCK